MPRGARAALAALVAAGAALRLWQYLANTSLWIDEIALAENVLHLSARAPAARAARSRPGRAARVPRAGQGRGRASSAPPRWRCGWCRCCPASARWRSLRSLARRFQPAVDRGLRDGALRDRADAHRARRGAQALFDGPSRRGRRSRSPRSGWTIAQRAGRWIGATLLGAVAVWFSQGAVFVVAGLGAALASRRDRREARRPSRLIVLLAVWAASAGLAVGLAGSTACRPRCASTSTASGNRRCQGRRCSCSSPWPAFCSGGATIGARRCCSSAPCSSRSVAAAAHLYPFVGPRDPLPRAGGHPRDRRGGGLDRRGSRAARRAAADGGGRFRFSSSSARRARSARLSRRRDAAGARGARAAAPARRRDLRLLRGRAVVSLLRAARRASSVERRRPGDVPSKRPARVPPRARGAARQAPRLDLPHARRRCAWPRDRSSTDTSAARKARRDDSGARAPRRRCGTCRAAARSADDAETYPLPIRDIALAERFGCDHGPIGRAPWD